MDKQETKKYFEIIQHQNTNNLCFDCLKQSPTWVNLKYSVIICTDCAVLHRKNGFTLKSILLDIFTEEDVKRVVLGGNFIYNTNVSFVEKYNDIKNRIEELNEKLEMDTRKLNEIIGKNNDLKSKVCIKEESKPIFGKKVDRLKNDTKKNESEESKEVKVVRNVKSKAVINEEFHFNKANKIETDDVKKNKIGLGIFRIEKEKE
ncbi:zinc finger protein [Tubulinosema ratisbonensis]|uniref:Zinc finger protein n=1 Tax=Tubulinosema ratisbonensis TaxID=291195 RepID=A0A437AN55_9MICR|nr:zinc finger protein [Tubulinosema ratisbonensis]